MARLEVWTETPDVCGSCVAWRAPDVLPPGEDDVPVGSCRLRSEMGRVPAALEKCPLYRARGAAPTARRAPARARRKSPGSSTGDRPAVRAPVTLPPASVRSNLTALSGDGAALRAGGQSLLRRLHGPGKELTGRFEGGTYEIRRPDAPALTGAIEVFFGRLVRLANDLDVLEERVQSLGDDAQAAVRRCRGSLTTFNILFHDKGDHFRGG